LLCDSFIQHKPCVVLTLSFCSKSHFSATIFWDLDGSTASWAIRFTHYATGSYSHLFEKEQLHTWTTWLPFRFHICKWTRL